MKQEKSCGAVVYIRERGKIRYLLVKNLSGCYGFPKGHVEAGETEQETACREILEETGLEVSFAEGFRAVDAYDIPWLRVSKQVVYFLAEAKSSDYRFQKSEISGGGLYSFEKATDLLRFAGAKGILREAHTFLSKILA